MLVSNNLFVLWLLYACHLLNRLTGGKDPLTGTGSSRWSGSPLAGRITGRAHRPVTCLTRYATLVIQVGSQDEDGRANIFQSSHNRSFVQISKHVHVKHKGIKAQATHKWSTCVTVSLCGWHSILDRPHTRRLVGVWAYASRHHLGHDTQRMMMEEKSSEGEAVLRDKSRMMTGTCLASLLASRVSFRFCSRFRALKNKRF
jgi:hypothetical protein